MYAEDEVSDEDIIQRFQKFYGDEKFIGKEQIKDDLLCMYFGMREWNEYDTQEIIRQYRQFVYETGAVVDRDQRSGGKGN